MRQNGGLWGSETQPWESTRQITAPHCHGNAALFICLGVLLFHMHFPFLFHPRQHKSVLVERKKQRRLCERDVEGQCLRLAAWRAYCKSTRLQKDPSKCDRPKTGRSDPLREEAGDFSLPSRRMFLRETSVAAQMRLLCLSPGATEVMNGTVERVWTRPEKDLCNKLQLLVNGLKSH